jgi:PAS domain S-box-containing protein
MALLTESLRLDSRRPGSKIRCAGRPARLRGEGTIDTEKPPELLKSENQRLRQRIAELEGELDQLRSPDGGSDRRLTQLIRKKDLEIEETHEELKAKAAEAQSAARELATKNEELTNSMVALRLYQLMFENDPHGLIGVSPDGQIVQFNSSAIRFFGYDLHKMRMRNVADLEMPETSGVDLKDIFDRAMQDGESPPVECSQKGRQVRISCFRMEDIRGQRGAVFRFNGFQK